MIFPRRVAGSGLANPPVEPGKGLSREGRERRRPVLVNGCRAVGDGRVLRTPVARGVRVERPGAQVHHSVANVEDVRVTVVLVSLVQETPPQELGHGLYLALVEGVRVPLNAL